MAEALADDERGSIGELMAASHRSLRDLFDVVPLSLDRLVDAALECPGVAGARMTGAGFGGCTVNLVERDHAEAFVETMGGVAAAVYRVDVVDGAGPASGESG
jgi:galactokinase